MCSLRFALRKYTESPDLHRGRDRAEPCRARTHSSATGWKSEPTQLALALDHAESLAREDFLSGPSNAAALALIERWPDGLRARCCCGGRKVGKKSSRGDLGAGVRRTNAVAARLDGAEVPVALATGALVLENLADGRFDEAALFHLLNLAREERAYVLITARSAPATWRTELPDLASRLRAFRWWR